MTLQEQVLHIVGNLSEYLSEEDRATIARANIANEYRETLEDVSRERMSQSSQYICTSNQYFTVSL